jgi:cytochrome c553
LRVITFSHGVCFVVGLLCTASAAEAQETRLSPGARLLAPFKRDLQQALRDGLAAGPVEAIAACRIRAPEIADSLSRKGVRIGRTSHRLRNPSNAAPEWVQPILEGYVNDPLDRTARTVALRDNRSGYVEPILLQPMCLTCHGRDLAPEVASRISELYPSDRATGFDVGDLRGVFWVEFPDPK